MIHFFKHKLSVVKNNRILFAMMIILTITNFNIKRWEDKKVIKWDVTSYYAYLPAIFIYNDLSLTFIEGNEKYYKINQMFWPETSTNGAKVIKTTMGMSMLYAPFFALGHVEALLTNQSADGFSIPYQKWIHLSALFYLLFGLYFLNKFLIEKFNTTSSSITISAIILGTNLFYYATTEAAMSHIYSFSLISAFIYFFDSWYYKANIKKSVIIGLLLGLIVLIRPINLLIVLFALTYNVTSVNSLKNNFKLFFNDYLKLSIVLILISIVINIPQLVYWKVMTGNWLFNSYVGETFYFAKPHIKDLLFSFRKGWLLYTPIMSFSIVGFIFLYKNYRGLFWSSISTFIVFTYVISSWWCWWYGGSFGLRAMIDLYPLLSIPLASLTFHIFRTKRSFIQFIYSGSLIVLIALNLFETKQYKKGIIHWDSMTKEAYLNSFGKLKVEQDFKLLFSTPDYKSAKAGKKEYLENR